jgi:hypothetical protein
MMAMISAPVPAPPAPVSTVPANSSAGEPSAKASSSTPSMEMA